MTTPRPQTIHIGRRFMLSKRLGDALDAYFATLGLGVNAYELIQDRRIQLKALDDLDDVALFQKGLLRGEIPRCVFKDLFG